jgi:uncharacterized protein (TIGR02118 family)
MSKVIFVLQRRADRTPEEVREHWSGEAHVSKVRNLPGLTKFVQNYVVASPAGHICDGIGELWFENNEVMEKALNSPEMGAAVESATNFLDMEKTGLIIVEEATLTG